jgi:hypothetical protein
MMKRRHKLFALSQQERRVLFYAVFLLNGLRLALWLFPFKAIKRQLANLSSVWVDKKITASVSVEHIVWAVSVASRYTPGRAMCLVQALTTQQLLFRYGYAHHLHIGVTKSAADTLNAHAWIEYEGCVIVGSLTNLSQFKPLVPVGVSK